MQQGVAGTISHNGCMEDNKEEGFSGNWSFFDCTTIKSLLFSTKFCSISAAAIQPK